MGAERDAPRPDAGAVREEIDDLLARHAEALARGDVDTALELYMRDAIVRPANMEPVRGHTALREFFTAWFSAMSMEVAYTTEEMDVYDGTAYQIGTYAATVQPHGGAAVRDRGSFSVVWKRQPDGSWLYHRGIFNSSLPAKTTITDKGQ